jgi:hypothetical protein
MTTLTEIREFAKKENTKMVKKLNKLMGKGPITILKFYESTNDVYKLSKQLDCLYDAAIEEGEFDVEMLSHTPLEEIAMNDIEVQFLFLTESQYVVYTLISPDWYSEQIYKGNLTQQMIDEYEKNGVWE